MPREKRTKIRGPRISNVTQFLDRIPRAETELGRQVFYRGQAWARDTPMPQIDRPEWRAFRRVHGISRKEHEQWLLKEFHKAALPHLGLSLSQVWELTAAAQHHGLATRFLDWSASPLAALYFAVEHPTTAIESAVYCYSHRGPSHVSYSDPFCIDEVVTYTPPHVSPRITSQMGRFTVHPRTTVREYDAWAGRMHTVLIPRSKRAQIRRELNDLGIARSVLFPDLDGIARHTNYRFSVPKDERSDKPAS